MLNEKQAKRFEEVLEWPADQRRSVLPALHYVFGTGAEDAADEEETAVDDADLEEEPEETEVAEAESDATAEVEQPWSVPTVCPVVQEYAMALGTLDDTHQGLLWNKSQASSIQCIFGTENEKLVERRVQMMIGFLKNCIGRIAERIPAKEPASSEGTIGIALRDNGALAAAVALSMVGDHVKLDKVLVQQITSIVDRWYKTIRLRSYDGDADKSLLAELRNGSMWLLFEMSVMK